MDFDAARCGRGLLSTTGITFAIAINIGYFEQFVVAPWVAVGTLAVAVTTAGESYFDERRDK